MKCGLLGGKLKHSYSPQIHKALGDYSYELYEKSPEELDQFLKTGNFSGLNVTIPYKKTVIPYCDELSPIARQLGAVNTIVRKPNGKLIGHNTDFFGFETMLHRSGLSVARKKVLVLGSGGASNTVCAVLKQHKARVVVISRTGENHYQNLHRHADASVIVNTTPVGMFPDVGISPVELSQFVQLEGVLDVVYNPSRTQLLLAAQARGLVTMNGLLMLVAQAKESAEWFTGKKIPDSMIDRIHTALRIQMKNIVLVGMPGCGKSTIGHLLAQKLQRQFVDADQVITSKAGLPIPKIFENGGETGFRALETQVLTELGRKSGLVIATGGGCVTKEENYPLLHQNATIIWLQRQISMLPVEGRPLSQAGDLNQMYQLRAPMYRRFADFSVCNDVSMEETVDEILKKLEEMG